MLSKFIYRFVTVLLLVVLAQVGYSQNYVSPDAAKVILEQAIAELEADLNAGPVYTGKMQLQVNSDVQNKKIKLQLMKSVKEDISVEKSVQTVMDSWYQKANAQGIDRKTKLTLALNGVKALLS